MKESSGAVEECPAFRIEKVLKNFEAASSGDHSEDVDLVGFIGAYEELNKFIGLLGKIFHFVQIDVREKTNKLQYLHENNPDSYRSVKSMVLFENERRHYPGSKALLALHRALEFIVAFLNALAQGANDESVSSICRKTYEDTLARFHSWVIRKAVGLALYTLPSRGQLISSIQGSVPEEEHLCSDFMTTAEWTTQSVRSLPLRYVTFDPTNELVAACTGADCLLFSVSDGKRVGVCEHTEEIVSVFFTERHMLIAVSKCGEVVEWTLTEDGPKQSSSSKVTAFPVIRVFYLRDDKRCVLITDHETHYSVDCVTLDKSLSHIAKLPAGLGYEQVTVASSYVAYCCGKEVFVITTDEDSLVTTSNYFCKAHIEGIGERNSANVFVRIASHGDTLAATLTIGRVYIWSHVSRKGIENSAFTIHWHKVAPCLALTQFGGLLSAGAEAVLCKFALNGTGRPSMLPRLAAPVRDIAISVDASHVAIVLEDNSLHVVLTSTMTILSSLQTVVTCERSLTSVFTIDPCTPGTVVMNGKPGSLQWIQCLESFTLRQVSFSLENVADGDMSFAGITQTFPDIEQVFFSNSTVVTLERIINFEEDHKRLRFWGCSDKNDFTVQLMDSFVVPKDTVSLTGCRNPPLSEEKLFMSMTTSGKVYIWISCEEKTRFKLDPVRQIDRRRTFHCGSTIHNGMWAAAYPEGPNDTDVVVVWETAEMEELEILRTDGRARFLEFDSNGCLICATDRAVRCWQYTVSRYDLLWVMEQSLGVHLSPFGAFAWIENTVMEFDVKTAVLKGSFTFTASVTDLIAIVDKDSRLLVVARTAKGLLLAHPKSQEKTPEESWNRTIKTPFASLAPVETNVVSVSAKATTGPANREAAMRLLDGPCHALPPISHLAPLFITHCLAPPLQE